jgi:hypothetical protein
MLRSLLEPMRQRSIWEILGPVLPEHALWRRYLTLLARGLGSAPLNSPGAIGIGTNLPCQGSVPLSPRFLALSAKIRFQHRGDRAMCVHDGRSTKPLPEKEISCEHRIQIRA